MSTDIDTRFPDPVTGDKRVAVWRDKGGVLHRAVGAYVHRGIRLMWTSCGKKDIPENGAWLQKTGDYITCPDCEAMHSCPRRPMTPVDRIARWQSKSTVRHVFVMGCLYLTFALFIGFLGATLVIVIGPLVTS